MTKKLVSSLGLLAVVSCCALMVLVGCETTSPSPSPSASPDPGTSEFETLRARIAEYVGGETTPIITPDAVKAIVDDEVQAAATQIVSVRSAEHYAAGHVPGAINIPWRTIADEASTDMLSDGSIVAYCYTGHTGQVSTSILGVLGYDVQNMKFGMMGWNTDYMGGVGVYDCNPPQYDVELEANTLPADQELPTIETGETTAEAIARAQAQAFLPDWGPTINPADVKAIVDDEVQAENYVIVSVRSAEHYAAGHIPGAINIPWKSIADEENLKMLPTDKTIICYCYTGHTGQIATTMLKLLGYDAVNMKFGMMGWNTDYMGGVATYSCNPPQYDVEVSAAE